MSELLSLLLSSIWGDEALYLLQAFMQKGGWVLWWLAAVASIICVLMIERILYLYFYFPADKRRWMRQWSIRQDKKSWYAVHIRQGWISEAFLKLHHHLSAIRVLISICPMLGLLGTVTGMISVFDVMATQGSSDAKLMASGVSLATLPTMTGMVISIAGMFIYVCLRHACQRRQVQLEKAMRIQS